MLRLSKSEFKKLRDSTSNKGLAGDTGNSLIRKNNLEPSEKRVYDQALEILRCLKSFNPDSLYAGPVKICVEADGDSRCDMDNIFKAIADGLQGICYKNDRQVKAFNFVHKDYDWD